MKINGLPNIGNTCYLNSTLQCLFSFDSFLEYIDKVDDLFEIKSIFGTHEEYMIFIEILNKKLPTHFNINDQNDVHEFMIYLIDIIYERTKRKFSVKNNTTSNSLYKKLENNCNQKWFASYSPIMDVLYFQIIRQTKCSSCDNRNLNFENNSIIEIDIQEANDSVTNSLKRYFDTITVNDWTCDKCQMNSEKNLTFQQLWYIPEILVISIKRFKYVNGKMVKLKYPMSICDIIDIENYCLKMETSYKYKLKCVINHIGSSYYGHYNTDIVIDENRSIKIDDLNLKLNTNKIKDVNNCYVLFYEKVKK